MSVTIRAKVDGDPDLSVLDAEKQIEIELLWTPGLKPYICGWLTLTHNPEFPTPVVTIVLAHPGIRFDVFDYKEKLVATSKPRPEEPQP